MPPGSPSPSGGGKILGLRPRTALIALGAAAAAGIVWFWWRSRSGGQQQPATSGGGCTDGNGNSVPCPEQAGGIDYSGQLSVIQTELETLLGEEGGPAAGSGGGATTATQVTVPNVKGMSVTAADAAITAAGLVPGTHSKESGTVNGQTPGAGAKVASGSTVDLSVAGSTESEPGGPSKPGGPGGTPPHPPPVPSGVRISGVTSSGFTASWSRATGATSYKWRVTYQGKVVGQGSVTGTSAKVSGLQPDHTYTFHVASVGPNGTSAETSGPAARTGRG